MLGGSSRTVIGVMPPRLLVPESGDESLAVVVCSIRRDRVGEYTLIGRIAPGLTMDAMQAPLEDDCRDARSRGIDIRPSGTRQRRRR